MRYEKAYIHRDGHHIPILVSYRLLKRRPGWDKDRLLCTCVDLTEAKAKERELEEEKKKSEEIRTFWETLINAAPVGMVVYDVDGRYHNVNPKFCDMTKLSKEELLSPTFDYKTILAEKLDDTLAHVKKAMDTGQPQTDELAITTKDGRVEALTTTARLPLYDNQGLPLHAAWIQDISALKRQEKEVRQLLDNAQTYLQRLAQAQLIHDDIPKDGAARTIQETYNQCVDHLQALVQDISNAAHTLMSLSEELAQNQADLSRRSSREAASLEEISANTEEIATTVSENSKHADETQGIAEEVLARLSTAAQSCAEVVDIIMTAARSAQETTAITKAIQDIAFTTNILSLNASVEAARAGKEGKGFAVIAEEIRKLAIHSNQEAKRAGTIIGELVVAMDKGEKGLQAMDSAIDDVTGQASTMVEHVAAIAEEIHATSESLTSQTENLMAVIDRFHLDDSDTEIKLHHANTQEDLVRIARKAIAAHYRWRQQLIQALQEGTPLDPAEVGDFRHCAFGQILTASAALQAHPAYQRTTQLHQAFHQEGQHIAELLRQGQRQEARKALLGDSHYNQLTRALAETMGSLTSKSGQSRADTITALRPPQSGRRHPAQSTPKASKLDGAWEEF